jgi:tagatose-1,6-bisphosphate aldolase non-catalytic subunit AgaZ/GatZ
LRSPAMTDRELLMQAMEALGRAEMCLRPMADSVFNDNGDITVSNPPLAGYEDCVKAYYVSKKIDAVHAAIAEALKEETRPAALPQNWLAEEVKKVTPGTRVDSWFTKTETPDAP